MRKISNAAYLCMFASLAVGRLCRVRGDINVQFVGVGPSAPSGLLGLERHNFTSKALGRSREFRR